MAKIIPLLRRRRWLPAAEIGHELMRLGPDTTGLAAELRETLAQDIDYDAMPDLEIIRI